MRVLAACVPVSGKSAAHLFSRSPQTTACPSELCEPETPLLLLSSLTQTHRAPLALPSWLSLALSSFRVVASHQCPEGLLHNPAQAPPDKACRVTASPGPISSLIHPVTRNFSAGGTFVLLCFYDRTASPGLRPGPALWPQLSYASSFEHPLSVRRRYPPRSISGARPGHVHVGHTVEADTSLTKLSRG